MVFSKSNTPPGFYVYLYLRRDGTPYYVGKGKGNRAWFKPVGIKPPKDPSRIIILVWDVSEIWALITERYYIKWFGRKDNNTGILWNMTDGGDGLTNPSDELRKRIAEKSGRPQPKGEQSRNWGKKAVRDLITGDTFLVDKDDLTYQTDRYESAQKGYGVGGTKPGTSKALKGRKKPDMSKRVSGKGNPRYDNTKYIWINSSLNQVVYATMFDFRSLSGLSDAQTSNLKFRRSKTARGWRIVDLPS